MTDRPRPVAYDPWVTTGRPGGRPDTRPRFRPLVHKGDWKAWEAMIEAVGTDSAQRLWDHLAFRADQKPQVGKVTPLKGKHVRGRDGWSRVYHYAVSGAGRVIFQYHKEYAHGASGQPHAVVRIVSIAMSSH